MRLAGRQWSLLLRSNGITIGNLCTSALRWRSPNDAEARRVHDALLTPANQHLACRGATSYERRRDQNGEYNSCERSCVRYGHRGGYRRWTNRVQRADVLLLLLQVQRELRS